MGLKVAPAEVARWVKAGLIPPAGRTPRVHHLPSDGRRPEWRVVLLLAGVKLVSRSNAREHWAARHKRDRREAATVRAAWLAAGMGEWQVPLPAVVTLTRTGGKPMDGDNLQSSLKAVRDAVAALVGVDDGDERIHWRYRDKPGRGAPGVTITIRPRHQ